MQASEKKQVQTQDVEPILKIRDLCVDYFLPNGILRAVNHVNLDVPTGKITGLVGESGSGKTTLTSAILRTVSNPGKITKGSILFGEKDIVSLSDKELREYRWRDVAMVFQAAQNCLNPTMTLQEQFIETYLAHKKDMSEKEIIEHVKKLLRAVRLDADRVLKSYPHEMSGGMKQRIMIAFAQLLEPEILFLDEPTTALDVITQDYIFRILKTVHQIKGTTMVLSTHDIAVVATLCDYMVVMYGGNIVEFGNIYDMFEQPCHPYTQLLIQAAPSLIGDVKERAAIPGTAPDLMQERKGCIFADRCPYADDICRQVEPETRVVSEEHTVACHKEIRGKAI
ncbi:dipeptide/oligopeptide/nickel ABC transporter ATP-binding protein [Clostridium thermosuccinogenes]|jgi:peptide/nickel transport system ATP-binding protein|uniref:Dipeptide/oligopeptide/nickel ABC transporter ATP-binding protein n=2 Tax=Clostridium thermosuccinogenes TaxID=84032 RepID=A0A2K2F776_9CLOT|nr:ABC transporter ATP-binding protein [Pseudoclostridium thermosuccinogenes]AUS95405.1 dipeptide/oligopeptide/nickel ABC transporter ATP-binding protein [Pseudoclostridium thermosuccinogenes]AUS96502.1 dipeptide/oligopeptide/nickel ABC transporter ATP-binding protein [Pseudoclostridium thermosuccinogenes]PNT94614.1 dipeptide/oligopeptide/nickel ABC transporter ATP-binding protein [Pseudoclostridium thermosuccinogenes]PNT94879.1 dipeptide/oligopeptide/nickel ABC transporter ATP-binding protein 